MSLLTRALSGISKVMSNVIGQKPSTQVTEITEQSLERMILISRSDCLVLYRNDTMFCGVFAWPEPSPSKLFSLFQENSEASAQAMFVALSHKLEPLVQHRPKLLKCDKLQHMCDVLKDHPTWNCAHLAAKLCFLDFLTHATMAEGLNDADLMTKVTPVMVAIEGGNLAVIQELIIKGVDLDLADSEGRNVFHYAASGNNPAVIQLLASKSGSTIDQLDLKGESALHIASRKGNADILEYLLRCGADPNLTASGDYPMHCAVDSDKPECIETLHRWSKQQLAVRDSKSGNTPLHRAHTKQCIRMLTSLGCDVNTTNANENTPLHVRVLANDLSSVMALVTDDVLIDTNAIGQKGNNALHMAVEVGNPEMVQVLIVFGVDVDAVNTARCTARHLAATSTHKEGETMLYYLHIVGALRCNHTMAGCVDGCSSRGKHFGSPPARISTSEENTKEYLDNVATDIALGAAMYRHSSSIETTPTSSLDGTDGSGSHSQSHPGDRILCLDGGGIRGLILIQMLLAIEKVTGMLIRDSFDWIGGTSTGGILALAIGHGKTMRHLQALYFRLKDEVFIGKRPYDSEPLECFMKKEFGNTTRMTELKYPRVLVTGVLADRNPVELHFFRNYDPPASERDRAPSNFKPLPRPNEQYVWEAARSSGAAPTYFRAFGHFLDGGLMSNNPTLDIMTEVHEHNLRLKAIGKPELERKMHVVVSLGTGKNPPQRVKACDIYRPEGLFDIVRVTMGAKNLGAMLLDQVTQSEGQPVRQAKAWCTMIGVPHYRFSPQLMEEVQLDCAEDSPLIAMLWDTETYLHKNAHKLKQLAELLRP
ncbi:85/88 kDa calcium-independent phospholipase A2 [Lamellibrachia satsuma]|nr:85/88 kDa calcium-independent phospholipase A2 [Lamellibrachia satsuma]